MWLIEHPDRGIVEPEDLDHDYVLDIRRPYLGPVVGVRSGWTPLQHRNVLFSEPNLGHQRSLAVRELPRPAVEAAAFSPVIPGGQRCAARDDSSSDHRSGDYGQTIGGRVSSGAGPKLTARPCTESANFACFVDILAQALQRACTVVRASSARSAGISSCPST